MAANMGPGIDDCNRYNSRRKKALPRYPRALNRNRIIQMLRSLAISNFTIIDRVELDFASGFGAITGETGAGKSILVDALGQLLGDRAETTLVADGSRQADLSAEFDLAEDHPALDWLRQQALEAEGGRVLLRRVIPADGASRAWINGQQAAIGQLREIGALLVEIHGQHEHQRLTDPAYQRDWLDRQVKPGVRSAVAENARSYQQRCRELETLIEDAGGKDGELMQFQLAELDRLGLAEHEFERLEIDQRRLASVDELQRGYADALEALSGEPHSAAERTRQAQRALEAISDREPELAEILGMIATAQVNLDEADSALQRLNDELEIDPERLEHVEQRLARAISLARKHGVEPDKLPEFNERLRRRVDRIDQFQAERQALEKQVEATLEQWRESAANLHAARSRAAKKLSEKAVLALAELGMTEARLEFDLTLDPEASVSASGADRVEMLFSANPGQSPKPVKRVASGGELSRLSLALIIAAGDRARGRVRIFDEVDAGIGGETAHSVGRFLKQASTAGQALCVTHLAQVAARADYQFRVDKRPARTSTRIDIQRLDRDTRVAELARMLGSTDSETGRRHAESLLEPSE